MPDLAEPCMDPNPWDGQSTFGCPAPASPCGRPKGHDANAAGCGGSQWGGGHAERLGPNDAPTKRVIRIERWEVE